MEKNNENLEELKKILSDIKHAINIYNNLNPDNKVALVENDNNVVDITNTYICLYNNSYVGLFNKLEYFSKPPQDEPSKYYAGLIFEGLNSNYTGIVSTHRGYSSEYYPEPEGTRVDSNNNKVYVSNCKINKLMSFDDMRLIMTKKGEIGAYKMGESNSLEMQRVLEYAFSYYKLDKKHKRKKLT